MLLMFLFAIRNSRFVADSKGGFLHYATLVLLSFFSFLFFCMLLQIQMEDAKTSTIYKLLEKEGNELSSEALDAYYEIKEQFKSLPFSARFYAAALYWFN